MRLERLFDQHNLTEFIESLIPDFVLAFAFFTAIAYAVLGKRFEQQRPAIVMSVSMGFALSIGLVWWEQANGLSVKNLGSLAIGFAVLVLALIMYQSIKPIGGSWAAVAITIGLGILIAELLQLKLPIDAEIIQTVTVVALILGIIAFFEHNHNTSHFRLPQGSAPRPERSRSMADRYRDRQLSNRLSNNMRNLRKEAGTLNQRPQDTGNVQLQLKRMLPSEGYLTQRLAQLRAKAHQIRNGHIARLAETKAVFSKLPVSAKKKAAAEMAAGYHQLIGADSRLERLDKSVAKNEKRIKDLTQQAQRYTARHDHRKLVDSLKAAEKLQKHNSRLFKIIDHTENKLTAIAKRIAAEAQQVNKK